MITTANLAGFFAAHGIWCVSEGETLIPLLGYEGADGDRGMARFVDDDLADAARAGQEALAANEQGAAHGVLVADTYLHLDDGKIDALLVEAVEYGEAGRRMTVAVPYRPAGATGGFAVHSPKFLGVEGWDDSEIDALAQAFFDGVSSHEDAAAVWAAHQDTSI